MTDGLTWSSLVGGVALLGILAVLSFAAIAQQNHDALVALISLVTGAGIGAGTVAAKQPSAVVRSLALEVAEPAAETPQSGGS